jgi:predicted ATPase
LAIVATSRRPLGLESEVVLEMGELEHDGAVALLRHHSGRDDDLDELARRLDGLPLALELAAARLRLMSPRQVLERLDQRLHLLASGERTLEASLRASWDLLDGPERAVLAQLTVFRGSASLEAVDAVVALPDGAPWALDVVGQLVQHSLVAVLDGRVHIAESVRAFAVARLGDDAAVARRHGEWFASLNPDLTAAALMRSDGLALRRDLRLDLDNLVLASRRAVADGRVPVATATARLVAALLHQTGPFDLMVTVLEQAATIEEPSSLGAAHLQRLLAVGRRLGGDIEGARAAALHALELSSTYGATIAHAAFNQLGQLDAMEGRDTAMARFEAALEAAHTLGDAERGLALGNLGTCSVERGELALALERYQEALVLTRRAGNRSFEAVLLSNLGLVHQRLGDPDQARAGLTAGLALHREEGHLSGELAGLFTLGALEFSLDDAEGARQWWRIARECSQRLGDPARHAMVIGGLGAAEANLHHPMAAIELLREGVSLARRIGDRRREGLVQANLASVLSEVGRLEEADQEFSAALMINQQTGDQHMANYVAVNLGTLSLERGQVRRARELMDGAMPLIEQVDAGLFHRMVGSWAVSRALSGGPPIPSPMLAAAEANLLGAQLGAHLCAVAELCVLDGAPELARDALDRALPELESLPADRRGRYLSRVHGVLTPR